MAIFDFDILHAVLDPTLLIHNKQLKQKKSNHKVKCIKNKGHKQQLLSSSFPIPFQGIPKEKQVKNKVNILANTPLCTLKCKPAASAKAR
jgi:hypothetical protein